MTSDTVAVATPIAVSLRASESVRIRALRDIAMILDDGGEAEQVGADVQPRTLRRFDVDRESHALVFQHQLRDTARFGKCGAVAHAEHRCAFQGIDKLRETLDL